MKQLERQKKHRTKSYALHLLHAQPRTVLRQCRPNKVKKRGEAQDGIGKM
jgi:hypothetical protein